MNKWRGILTIIELQHLTKDGEVLTVKRNLKNMLHTEGEQFILSTLFSGNPIPDYYYFGLDNRSSLASTDTMDSLSNEPDGFGYVRGAVANSEFTISELDGVQVAYCPILTFRASGGSWGPVSKLFMTNASDDSGDLISSVALSQAFSLTDGQSLSLRMGISLGSS